MYICTHMCIHGICAHTHTYRLVRRAPGGRRGVVGPGRGRPADLRAGLLDARVFVLQTTIYLFICVCVYISIYIYICVRMCMYIYIYMYYRDICMYVCMYVGR